MNAKQRLAATTADVDVKEKHSSSKTSHTMKLNAIQSQTLSGYISEKEKAVSAKLHADKATVYMGDLKDAVKSYIETEFHGTTPPQKVNLEGEISVPIVDEHGRPVVDIDGNPETITQAVSTSLTVGKTYGKKQDYVQYLEDPEKIRGVVGNEWFESHVDDMSRFTVHLAMIKKPEVREQFMDALCDLVTEWELPRKDEDDRLIEEKGRIPRGTMKYNELHKVKDTFHTDRFELDVARHNALKPLIGGGCSLTAERFKG